MKEYCSSAFWCKFLRSTTVERVLSGNWWIISVFWNQMVEGSNQFGWIKSEELILLERYFLRSRCLRCLFVRWFLWRRNRIEKLIPMLMRATCLLFVISEIRRKKTIYHVDCMDFEKWNEWLLSLGNTVANMKNRFTWLWNAPEQWQ